MGYDQHPTEGDSRMRGTREPLQQATDVRAPRSWTQRADGLAASAAAVTLVSILMVRWQRKPCHWSLTGPQHNEVVIEVMSPLKSAPTCRGFWTHILHKIPFTHTSLSPKWHLNQFIRFRRTHSCVTQTQRLGTTVTTNCILCVTWQCWLMTISCQILGSMWLFWVKCHLTVQRMMRCWRGYLSEARCRLFAYGLADATASQKPIISCLIEIQTGFTILIPAYPGCSGKKAEKQVS